MNKVAQRGTHTLLETFSYSKRSPCRRIYLSFSNAMSLSNVWVTSSYYVDRITFELDLMAPIGKTFRKAIDINCSSGAWAMVRRTFKLNGSLPMCYIILTDIASLSTSLI